MKRFLPALFLVSLSTVSFVSCDKGSDFGYTEPDNGYVFLTGKAAADLPEAERKYVGSVNDYAFQVLGKEEPEVFSPLGSAMLLAMLAEGAEGETRDEICQVLGYSDPSLESLRQFCLDMTSIARRSGQASFSHAAFLNDRSFLLDSYQKRVKEYYDAIAVNLDFSDQKKALAYINGWAEKKTGGLIPDIMSQLGANAFAYLMTTAWFKASWQTPFEGRTSLQAFRYENGRTGQVEMMQTSRKVPYYVNDWMQAVRLDYEGGDYAMYVILPEGDHTLSGLVKKMDSAFWTDFLATQKQVDADIRMPKFVLSEEKDLKDALKACGMRRAFSDGADFSSMSVAQLYISGIMQKSVIRVSETGTEAASVSVAEMMAVDAPGSGETPLAFHADRPFLYLIANKTTGAILYEGLFR